MSAVPRLGEYEGPAVFSYGFRPFFLLAAAFAGGAIPLWLGAFYGGLVLPSAFTPRDWHVHEMLYGYVSAVLTGFLLTAIPNWTGRLPLQGNPLLVLTSVWLAGRIAVLFSMSIGWLSTALIDVSFLLLVLAAVIRELSAGRNWSNLKVAVLVALFASGNIAFHLESHLNGAADWSIRLGLATVVLLIMVIGGRIIPSFTRGWLSRERPAGRLPATFGRFDVVSIVASVPGLTLWVMAPDHRAAGFALCLGGCAQLHRLGRWAGERTIGESLVLILHLGYAFIPLGFLLTGASILGFGPAAAGAHAWGGAIAVMTVAVMTRASLGHTRRALAATAATKAIYVAVLTAAIARVAAAAGPFSADLLVPVAGLAWTAGFLGFVVAYAPVLCRPARGPAG